MGFTAVDALIGTAKRANPVFNAFDEPETEPSLCFPRVLAHRAFDTLLRHLPVPFGNGLI